MAFDIKRSLTDVVKHISMFDPAVDIEHKACRYQDYMRTGDETCLVIRDGHVPARFTLAHVNSRQYRRAYSATTDKDRHYALVAFALVAVDGITVNGRPFTVARKTIDGLEMCDAGELDQIYDPDLFIELAGRVEMMRRLDPTRLLGSETSRS